MKRFLIFFVLGLLWINAFSQDWAPIGAEWYYGEGFAFSGDIDYILYTSVKDTIVKGQTCRKITKPRGDFTCYFRPRFELMFSQNDSVFFYDPKLDTFQLLYDFNAIKNDSWFFTFKDISSGDIDTVNIHVVSIGSITANSKTLKSLYVTYTSSIKLHNNNLQHQSKIIEKIGDISIMFNFYPDLACDANYSNGIRCYKDSVIGNYHFPSKDSCTYTYIWTGIKDVSKKNITLYPNPANELVRINGLNQVGYYNIYDINGKLIISGIIKDSQILIKNLLKGFYTIRITDKNRLLILSDKIIKN